MGKRKERRLAAMSGSGRRVKLDLSAEPSGDLGGSDVHDGVGREKRDSNGLPNSPSSSGQKAENPLLLLGQYSDDELEEVSDVRANDAAAESSLADNGGLVEGSSHGEHKDMNVNSGADTAMQKVDQVHAVMNLCARDIIAEKQDDEVTESDSTALDGLHKQTDSSVQASVPVPSEVQVIGDVISGWNMVLHVESNQYYYWNTETGETSWEVPEVLSQAAGVTYNQETCTAECKVSGPVGAYESNLVSCVEPSNTLPVQNIISESESSISQKTMEGIGPRMVELECKREGPEGESLGADGDQSECQRISAVNYLLCPDELTGPGTSSNDALANSENRAAADLPTHLLGQSERLLEKLRSLRGSHENLHTYDWISKCILEVEVRHSDIRALMSDTSSLLSFWLHTEKQLKLLEDKINDEIYQLAKSAVLDEIEDTDATPSKEKEKSQDSVGSEPKDSGREGEVAHSGEAPYTDETSVMNAVGLCNHCERNSVKESDVTASDEVFQKASSQVVEDVDMDVDMEVEESVPASSMTVTNASSGQIFCQTEQSNIQTDASSVAAFGDALTVPPPPVEEWIPPPPPPADSEDIPPPPPDTDNDPIPQPPPCKGQVLLPPTGELQGLSYLPPLSFPQQSATYAAQYSLSYPESNYQYYGNVVTQASNGQFYGHVDGSQVTLPSATFYYGSIPSTSSEAALTAACSVESYYKLKEGTVPSLPVISAAESSQYLGGSGSVIYNAVSVQPTVGSAVVEPSTTANDRAFGGSAETSSSGIPSSSSAENTLLFSQSANVSTGTVAGSSLSAKGQSKVARSKKRTVPVTSTLRSNKKVSSLVDKWKAAKEELNESEDEEPVSAHEILERKRQREIEEWKARQIASGEAKDNANFQPLGGDWREKVKRRRAQAAREAAESTAEPQKDESHQPDLTQPSKDLPSGWQAYWDESTKQVYYVNSITYQSTWVRPIR